jgi:hypothetical protein
MTTVTTWDAAVNQCGMPRRANQQDIAFARLRPLQKKGGVMEKLVFRLYSSTTLTILYNRQYTTIPFSRLSEKEITDLRILSGHHKQAIELMLSDLNLQVKQRSPHVINFLPSVNTIKYLPYVLRPYIQETGTGLALYSNARTIKNVVEYTYNFLTNANFNILDIDQKKQVLSQTVSALLKDGWYLNCRGQRFTSVSPTGKINSLTTLAEHTLHRSGTFAQQRKWDDLIHARPRSGSSSSSFSSSSSDLSSSDSGSSDWSDSSSSGSESE